MWPSVSKYLLLAPLAFLGACQSVGAGQYVGRGEFDTLTRRVEEVEVRVGLPPWGGSLPALVSASGTGPAPAALKPPAGRLPAPAGGRPSSAEAAVYQDGQRLLKAGQYGQAAGIFNRMLAENPGGRLAPNARYWLGECYYAQGRFGEAANEFQRCADDYPRTDKAADALLKLSYSHNRLGNGPRAMAALDRLLGQYPNSNAAGLIKSGRGHF
jgi:tol-pal system protein YbgF